jgi:hypothetical protein
MTAPPVLVRISDPASIARCYRVQQAMTLPVHLWFTCPLGLVMRAEQKGEILDRLEGMDFGGSPGPWVRPIARARHEGWHLRRILEHLLVPAERRCFTSRSRGRFHYRSMETGIEGDTMPFPGEFFLVTNERCVLGHGTLASVLQGGEWVDGVRPCRPVGGASDRTGRSVPAGILAPPAGNCWGEVPG